MKKIVFILYHPSGLSNWIVKLMPYMSDTEISVFHIAKLHSVKAKTINGVNLYDISGLSYTGLLSIIDGINPDLMVFLSFRSLLELVLQRICVSRGIRQLYVEHGLFSNDTLKFRTSKLKSGDCVAIKRQLHFLNLSLSCIAHSKNFFKELSLFYNIYLKKKFYLSPHNHYFLFSERSRNMMGAVYNFKDNVEYVGYPIFMDEAQKDEAKGAVRDAGGVLYVHQPLISDGIAKITFEDEKAFIVKMAAKLEVKYGKLTILLHPRSELKEYIERFSDVGIDVVQSPNNFMLFVDKSLIVGHYSTALLYGLYFDKPTLVLDYPSMQNDKLFNEFYTYVPDLDDLDKVSIEAKIKYKQYLVGDNNTFEYIAGKITRYVDDEQQNKMK